MIDFIQDQANIHNKYAAAQKHYSMMRQNFQRQFKLDVENKIQQRANAFFDQLINDWKDFEQKFEIKDNEQILGLKKEYQLSAEELDLFTDGKENIKMWEVYERFIQQRLIQNMNGLTGEKCNELLEDIKYGTGRFTGRSGRTQSTSIRADAIYINNTEITSYDIDSNNTGSANINGINLEVGINYEDFSQKIESDKNWLSLFLSKYNRSDIPFGFSVKHYNNDNSITFTSNKALMDDINKLLKDDNNGYHTLKYAYTFMLSQVANNLYPLIGPSTVALITSNKVSYTDELLQKYYLLYHLHNLQNSISLQGDNPDPNINLDWYQWQIVNSDLHWRLKNDMVNITPGADNIKLSFDLSTI